MSDLPPARRVLYNAPTHPPIDQVVLTQSERAIRVRALTTVKGDTFVVELPNRQSLEACFGFELEDGRSIAIVKAPEQVLEVRGDIARFAWHIGNQSLPCQIGADRLLVPYSPAVDALLHSLGAQTRRIDAPFSPEEMPHHDHAHHDDTEKAAPPPITGDPF